MASSAARFDLVVLLGRSAATRERYLQYARAFGRAALPNACNMAISDNNLITSAARVLQERLPPGWAIERVAASSRTPRPRITSKEGQARELPVSALSRPDPRAARQLPKERPLLVTAPYLSQGVREAIEDEGASYVDQTARVISGPMIHLASRQLD
jgi:hypothetical protein